MNPFNKSVTFILVALLSELNGIHAEDSLEEKQLRLILDTMEHRVNQRNAGAIWLKYKTEVFVSGRLSDALIKRAGNAQDSVSSPDTSFELVGEFALKGQKIRFDESSPKIEKSLYVYDGKLLTEYLSLSNTYYITVDRGKAPVCQPWVLFGEDNLLRDLKSWREKGPVFSPKVDSIVFRKDRTDKGFPLLLFEIKYDTGYFFKGSLREDLDFCINSLEHLTPKHLPLWRISNCSYQDVAGIPYPKSAEFTFFFIEDKEGKDPIGEVIAKQTRVNVFFFEADSSRIPDSLFQLVIPLRGKVFDLDSQIYLSEPSDEDLDGIADSVAKTSTNLFRFAVGGFLILSVISCLLFLRIRFKKRPKAP